MPNMTKGERWRALRQYWWCDWHILTNKGWYEITFEPDTRRVAVPLRFRRLGEAKKYCEVLDTLVDRTSLPDEYQYFDQTICAKAAKQMSLDCSRLSIADELREFAEDLERS